MNKYSQKIICFLNPFIDNIYKNDYENNNLVRNMIYTLINTHEETLNLSITQNIGIMHPNNDLYEIFKNSEIINEKVFYKWFRLNKQDIDLLDVLPNNYYHKNKHTELLNKLLYDNSFISLDVIRHAETSDITLEIYESDTIKIYLYFVDKKPNILLISKIISFLRKLFNNDSYINLIIFYGNQKKYLLQKSNKYIYSDSVNSGSTLQGKLIMIWRNEEFYKVLIHELIHYFGIDFYTNDSIYDEIYKIFEKKYNIDGVDRVNESYTETLALLIHSIIYSVIHNIDLNKIIQYEILFSYFQIAKIFNYFGSKIYFHQKTSVCSYYVVKCLFLMNIVTLLNYWKKNGFYIENNKKYIQLYNKLLNSSHQLDDKLIDKFIIILNNNNNNKFIYKTMRMSLFQL